MFAFLLACSLFSQTVQSFYVTDSSGSSISLYSDKDNVVDLASHNFKDTIFNSRNTIWVVEFYSHWCGHCQRFKPIWIKLAENFKNWDPHVKIAAINCATEDICDDFGIHGTPTIRIFFANVSPPSLGVDVPLGYEQPGVEFLENFILKEIEAHEGTILVPNGTPLVGLHEYFNVDEAKLTRPMASQTLVLVFEPEESSIGKKLLLQTGSKSRRWVLRVRTSAAALLQRLRITQVPAVVKVSDTQESIYYPIMTTGKTMKQLMGEIEHFLEWEEPESEETTTENELIFTTTDSTWPEEITMTLPEADESSSNSTNPDSVYAVDLEKMVEYAITREIPMQPVLDHEKLAAVYKWIEVVVQYLPVREQIKEFLKALREWPVKMNLHQVTSQDFQDKVTELRSLYRPFFATPQEWAGCSGSQPHLRGYPCSVWTSFHSMLTNAATKGDPAMKFGAPSTVAVAMTEYVRLFFSCRHCAENFIHKVNTIGFLPTTPQDSVLWLWNIHNRANTLLKGDSTEDPSAPKIVWPSSEACPACRASGDPINPRFPPVMLHGVFWNIREVASYLMRFYSAENVVPNGNSEKDFEGDELMKLSKKIAAILSEANGTMAFDLNQMNKVNDYCKSLVSLG